MHDQQPAEFGQNPVNLAQTLGLQTPQLHLREHGEQQPLLQGSQQVAASASEEPKNVPAAAATSTKNVLPAAFPKRDRLGVNLAMDSMASSTSTFILSPLSRRRLRRAARGSAVTQRTNGTR